jgi:hypothetical protein
MAQHVINGQPVRTHWQFPPIPIRSFDWTAVLEHYDLGAPIGYGATEKDAIADLLQQLADEREFETASAVGG